MMMDAGRCKVGILLICCVLLQGCGDEIAARRGELCKLVPGSKAFDAGRRVEGKVAVVYKGALSDPRFDNGCELDGYSGGGTTPKYFPEERYARSPEEIDTLIMIELTKGDFIKTTRYNMTTSLGRKVDVYTGLLKISIIDYRTSTLVRGSVRTLTKVPDSIQFDQLKHAKDSDTAKRIRHRADHRRHPGRSQRILSVRCKLLSGPQMCLSGTDPAAFAALFWRNRTASVALGPQPCGKAMLFRK